MGITRTVHVSPCAPTCHSRCRRRCSRAADEGLGRRLHTVATLPRFAGDARTRHSRANRSARRCRSHRDPAGTPGGRHDNAGERRNDRLRRSADPRRTDTADACGSAARSTFERSWILSIRRSIGDITLGDAATRCAATTFATHCAATTSADGHHNGNSAERRPTGRAGSRRRGASAHPGPASEPTTRCGATADQYDSHDPGHHHDNAGGRPGPAANRSVPTRAERACRCRSAGSGAVSKWQY